VDGIKQESGAFNELYIQSVEKGRSLVRELEAAVQSLYDDGSALLMAVQSIQLLGLGQPKTDRDAMFKRLSGLSAASKVNLRVVQQSLEALLSVGHHQADMSQGDYNGSIEWRMSRLSMIDHRLRPLSTIMDESYDPEGDVVDMEVAFSQPSKTQLHDLHKWDSTVTLPENQHIRNRGDSNASKAPTWGTRESQTPTMAADAPPETPTSGPGDATSPFLDDDCKSLLASFLNTCSDLKTALSEDALKRRGEAAAKKLEKVLGDLPTHYFNTVTAEAKPWYLRPNYDPSEIIIDPDGGVRGGTVPALVERLTAHEHGGP
jgi:son of sevenless-like protein